MFQSTHPGRGATKKGEAGAVIEGVSIHAPRAECDFTATFLQCCTSCFNPRTSGGVRHLSPAGKVGRVLFQSTHPGRGATGIFIKDRLLPNVSIHAPRAGCDACVRDYSACVVVSIHAPRAGCDAAIAHYSS